MKIINRKTFLTTPIGTLFMKYQRCNFGVLCEKCENCGDNDFWYTSITNTIDADNTGEFVDKLTLAENEGISVELCFDEERDAEFDDGQLFAIYERDDVVTLIARLNDALRIGYN